MTMQKALHSKDDTGRLYAKKKESSKNSSTFGDCISNGQNRIVFKHATML